MSIVIVGGNERMVCQYQNICKTYGCKAKVFAKENGAFKKKLGCPDLLILFTSTVSHKMVSALPKSRREIIFRTIRIHTSSAAALHSVLAEHFAAKTGGAVTC